MASKTLLLLAVLFTATVLFILSDVVAREMTEKTSNTIDTSVKSKGEVNDAKYPYGGPSPWWWKNQVRGGGCPFGCCGRGFNGCICCAYANQKPDADDEAVRP